jgi:hypothetical protein
MPPVPRVAVAELESLGEHRDHRAGDDAELLGRREGAAIRVMRLGGDLDHPDVADHVRRLGAAPDQPQPRQCSRMPMIEAPSAASWASRGGRGGSCISSGRRAEGQILPPVKTGAPDGRLDDVRGVTAG